MWLTQPAPAGAGGGVACAPAAASPVLPLSTQDREVTSTGGRFPKFHLCPLGQGGAVAVGAASQGDRDCWSPRGPLGLSHRKPLMSPPCFLTHR